MDHILNIPSSSRLNSPYLKTLGKSASKGKLDLREKVFDFVIPVMGDLKFHAPAFLSLPGVSWSIEHRIMTATNLRARFRAFEHNETLVYRSVPMIPHRSDRQKVSGWRNYHSLGVRYYRTNTSRMFFMDVLDAMTLNVNSHKPSTEAAGKFSNEDLHQHWQRKVWRGVRAVWLDFTSCLHAKMINSIWKLPELLTPEVTTPVVVTIQKGREDAYTSRLLKDLHLSRPELLAYLLSRTAQVEVVSTHEYNSSDGPSARMLSVFMNLTPNNTANQNVTA